jgi:hypothetical protein
MPAAPEPHGSEPIKILLHDNGADVETPWALPVSSPPDRILVRLDNVPFLHAKPTYGDVIEVRQAADQPGLLSWNAAGRSYDEICAALVEDGGRYAVIVDYRCDDVSRFGAMTAWAKREGDLECEGSSGPRDGVPGRLYIAARYAIGTDAIMRFLGGNSLGFRFELVHPR